MFETFARMGGIFITVGDLFACGKEHHPNLRPKWRHDEYAVPRSARDLVLSCFSPRDKSHGVSNMAHRVR